MNMTVGETEGFFKPFLIEIGSEKRADVVIVPPFTALAKAGEILRNVQNVKLGAQNMSAEKSGAFTGEISASMLRELLSATWCSATASAARSSARRMR